MRGNLVEQEERRMRVTQSGKFPGVSEDDGDQQRLLLAGRALPRIRALRRVANGEIRQVQAERRAAGLSVADAGARQLLAQRVGRTFALLVEQRIGFALRSQLCERNAPASPRASSARLSRATVSARLAVMAAPVSAISSSRPSSHDGSRGPNFKSRARSRIAVS